MEKKKDNLIVNKSIEFSLETMKFCRLLNQHKLYDLSKQLFRSSTSIGANVFEAQHAESRADFTHKMKVAAKEASETEYWLILCEESKEYDFDPGLKIKLESIMRILTSIITSSKSS